MIALLQAQAVASHGENGDRRRLAPECRPEGAIGWGQRTALAELDI